MDVLERGLQEFPRAPGRPMEETPGRDPEERERQLAPDSREGPEDL